MIEVDLGNININLKFKDLDISTIKAIIHQIHIKLDVPDPMRYRKRQYNLRDKYGHRVWDGYIKLCHFSFRQNKYIVPTGLFDDLKVVLDTLATSKGIAYNIVDKRSDKLRVKMPSMIRFNGHGQAKDITLRDYQMQSVKNAFNEQLGILLEATNSGKTALAYSIFSLLLSKLKQGQHLLYIAPGASIMNQVYKNFCIYLGSDKIGIWGDQKKDLNKPIIIATYQTLASKIIKPKIKLTRKQDRLVERMAIKYGPALLNAKGSLKANLKLLALNLHPRFKYMEDDPDKLKQVYLACDTDDDVKKVFKAYQKKYKHLLLKVGKKDYDRYFEATRFLKSVIAVIVDECQHASAQSFFNIFQYLVNARMRIGMTGTLDQHDKVKSQKIKALLGKPITNVTNDQMIKKGVSAKPYIVLVPVRQPQDLDLQIGMYMKRNGLTQALGSQADLISYQVAYKLGVVHNKYRNHLIAELATQSAKQLYQKAVLIITRSIEHGELIAQELDQLNAHYEFLQGKDDTTVREKVLNDVRSGKLKILIGTKILDEGIDLANLQVFINCDAGKSYIELLQRIGRILRIQRDKKKVYVFDLVDETTDILYRHAKTREKYYREEKFTITNDNKRG